LVGGIINVVFMEAITTPSQTRPAAWAVIILSFVAIARAAAVRRSGHHRAADDDFKKLKTIYENKSSLLDRCG
jgi:hypothetical protein